MSVYVLNQRIATVLATVSSTVGTLCPGFSTSDNVSVQLAVAAALLQHLTPLAAPAERVAALSDSSAIAKVMELALTNLKTPEAGLETCAVVSPANRAALFERLSKAAGYINAALALIPSNTTTPAEAARANTNSCNKKVRLCWGLHAHAAPLLLGLHRRLPQTRRCLHVDLICPSLYPQLH